MKTKLIIAASLAAATFYLTSTPAESYDSNYERRLEEAVQRNIDRQRQRLEYELSQPVRTQPQMIITPNGPAFIDTDRNGNAFGYGPAFDNTNREGFR